MTTTRLRESREPTCTFGYLDEAATSERYFGCGLLVHGPRVSGIHDERLNRKLRRLKQESGILARGDIGWKKVPSRDGKYLDLYQRLLDGFFRHPDLSFHALVADTHKYPLDSRKYFRGSKDAGIDGFAFHLVRSRLLHNWVGGSRLYLRFDRRSRPKAQLLASMTARLRAAFENDHITAPVAIQINSRSVTGGRHPLVQLTDLLLGCVVGPLNCNLRHHGKLALVDNARSHLRRGPFEATSPGEKKFSVWRFESESFWDSVASSRARLR